MWPAPPLPRASWRSSATVRPCRSCPSRRCGRSSRSRSPSASRRGSASASFERPRSTSHHRRRSPRGATATRSKPGTTQHPTSRLRPTVASGPCGRPGSITSASPSPTSTRPWPPGAASSAPSSRRARRSPTRASRAALLRVGDGRVELLASLGPDTPVGKFLERRGPGMHHVAFEVDDVAAELERLVARRCRADRRGTAARARWGARSRSSTRTPPAACSRSWSAVADAERIRLEIAFRGGQSLTVNVTPKTADELEAAPRTGRARRRDASTPRTAATPRSSAMIAFVKRHARESRVGLRRGVTL